MSSERIATWNLTQPSWGPALSQADYVTREQHLLTVPLAKDGGITHWILTDADGAPDKRNVYSSCETLRKPALVCGPETGGEVVEGIAHGVGSVFTPEEYRGKGYARKMMTLLGERLKDWDRAEGYAGKGDGEAANGTNGAGRTKSLFSVLYSDIGKEFYARTGWAPFTSTHIEFPAQETPPSTSQDETTPTAKPLTYKDLPALCASDEAQLRTRLAAQASSATSSDSYGTKKTCVALIPNHDTLLWHLGREDFYTNHFFHKTPTTKGAVYGSEPGKRIWGVWTHSYYGKPSEASAHNSLNFLRFVVEDAECSQEELVRGVRAVMSVAREEAANWACKRVELWNPEPRVRAAFDASGLVHTFVERDSESIASLFWFGKAPVSDIDWVLNEKYGWC
jgi:GNAT superfamily N-acetyltransferase